MWESKLFVDQCGPETYGGDEHGNITENATSVWEGRGAGGGAAHEGGRDFPGTPVK